MKNGKKLTVAEHKHITLSGLNSEKWLMSKKQSHIWTLIHRETKKVKTIYGPNL